MKATILITQWIWTKEVTETLMIPEIYLQQCMVEFIREGTHMIWGNDLCPKITMKVDLILVFMSQVNWGLTNCNISTMVWRKEVHVEVTEDGVVWKTPMIPGNISLAFLAPVASSKARIIIKKPLCSSVKRIFSLSGK